MRNAHKLKEWIKHHRSKAKTTGKLPGFVIYLNDFTHLSNTIGKRGFEFITTYFDKYNPKHALISSGNVEDIKSLSGNNYQLIVSSTSVDKLISINEYFSEINNKLEKNGLFILRFVPQHIIQNNIKTNHTFLIRNILFLWHFVFHRIFPKLTATRNIYFALTKGKKRSIRKLEMLGRLSACGFKLVNEHQTPQHLFLTVKKEATPSFDKYSSYGLLFKMRRIGKSGKEIMVYKVRTMVPFSEYLQEDFIKKNQLQKGGKICNDIRITALGKIMRKLWIDELPNFANVIKGEMKIVGVRPLSKQYLSMYTTEMQNMRKQVKPGIIPPFYVDLPETLEEIQESEKKYIQSYLKHPIQTDIKYFAKACKNIIVKRLTSN